MIRRARAGNTNPVLSTWDRKTNSWTSGAEQERKTAAALKSNSLSNGNITTETTEKPQNGNDANSSKSDDESGAEDSSNEYAKSADEDEFDGDETAPFKTSSKRRKVTSRHQGPDDTRTFEVMRWVPLAPSQADKVPERNYLAQRRPGMPALYAPDYAHAMFGQYHSSATVTGTSGYDIGEGGGLNNASGVLAAGTTNDAGTATPRKNIPPRRKKKKLGGPGRKKANPNVNGVAGDGTQQQNVEGGVGGGQQGGQQGGDGAMEGVLGEDGQPIVSNGNVGDGTADQDDGDNDESGSEAEGSEEGEIDEGGEVTTSAEVGGQDVVVQEGLPEQEQEQEQPLPTVTVIESIGTAPVNINITSPEIESTPAVVPDLAPEPTDATIDVATDVPPTNDAMDTTTEPVPTPHPTTEPLGPEPPITTEAAPETEAEVIPPTQTPPPQPPTLSTSPPPISIPIPIPIPISAAAPIDAPTASPPPPLIASITTAPPEPTINTEAEKSKDKEDGEVDFLGVMDAAIDREVSEGA